ncbi:iron-containing redox enzyme family protein [Umezawaea tangerina]|uniref:Heme oxygenase-like protein n=1 Tax=Umezawaea tangerina TaxID=84725 RepID=A0A2T0SYX1_9PSEU|nr:iron-containing redox enzyme family protein [Umezawaea tangerina]PRY38620.1 heme oxygenase-like protein [Umezawaea tangerina]
MRLPHPRGPVSAAVIDALGHPCPYPLAVPPADGPVDGIVHDEDLQLALWTCYEMHYRGFDGVDDDWEWAPSLIAVRGALEERWLAGLRLLAPPVEVEPDAVPSALAELVAADDGPSLAGFLQRKATLEQFREFVAQRSVYHLKEADPHSWGIPRLEGSAKAALIEIQVDEYGGGRVERMHSELFRDVMRALDLDDDYGHYVDQAPAVTLAVTNTISLFGLRRSLGGALIGHLAAFEMTSSLPNRRYGNGLRRLGGDATATRFYDEHVEADAVHEQIAAHDLCGGYARQHPEAASDILFGATACLAVEAEFGRYLLGRWESSPEPLSRTA